MFDLFFIFSVRERERERERERGGGGGGVVGSREEKIVADKGNCLPKLSRTHGRAYHRRPSTLDELRE